MNTLKDFTRLNVMEAILTASIFVPMAVALISIIVNDLKAIF